MIYLLALLALVAGALIPVQAAANAALSKSLTGGVAASALTLFAVAGTVALAAVAITRTPLPSWNEFRAAPVWSFVGGAIVATYVLTITFLAPRIGVGTAIAFTVPEQILQPLRSDHSALMRPFKFPSTASVDLVAVLMTAAPFFPCRRYRTGCPLRICPSALRCFARSIFRIARSQCPT